MGYFDLNDGVYGDDKAISSRHTLLKSAIVLKSEGDLRIFTNLGS